MFRIAFTILLSISLSSLCAQKPIDAMISPNPADQFCRISLSEKASLRLMDMQGREKMQLATASDFELDLSGLPEGIYFIHLVSDEAVTTLRLVHRSRKD